MAGGYFTLLGSLPHLPHFERAERNPISRLKLEQRLRMLNAVDADALALAEPLAAWQAILAKPRTDTALVDRYRQALASIPQPPLRGYLEYRLGLHSILAALRRRQAGRSAPTPAEAFGVGPWVTCIVLHWDEPDFRLARVHPWLPEARRLLQNRDALALERLLLEQIWTELGRIADADPFGFGEVVAYLFRWDILRYWFSRDAGAARVQFEELITEVTHGH